MKLNFKLTDETKINRCGTKLFRIEATCDIPSKNVKKGDRGGWVEKEENLSGNAWVYGDARVSGDAWVYGNARVYGNAEVSGDARVYDDAGVYGDARVSGDAWVYGDARVSGDARVYGNAEVYGDARVYGNAEVYGNAWVYGDARVSGKRLIGGYFYHTKEKSEKVEIMENDDDYETLCSEPEYGEDTKETITIGNNTYDKNEVEEALRNVRSL